MSQKLTKTVHRVAVLYQGGSAPIINGILKPLKPGGYKDSSADIAYTLQNNLFPSSVEVITPVLQPDPLNDYDWCFPDTVEGIERAINNGASTLWLNTILHSSHPINNYRDRVKVIGQDPASVEKYDDKFITNNLLLDSGLDVAASYTISKNNLSEPHNINMNELSETLLREKGLTFPDIIVKPIRGRGSQGVARVQTFDAMIQHITDLFESGLYGDKVMIEEYLPGDEVTISVLPPGTYYNPVTKLEFVKESYWTFNPVIRTGHVDGVAPYNGVVAVTKNSRALLDEELTTEMQTVCEHCERAAAICSARAIIRIDCRFDRNGKGKLFDLNMKPNMTGSGRIGRDDQDSLVAIACRGTASIGMWNYAYLLYNLLLQSKFI